MNPRKANSPAAVGSPLELGHHRRSQGLGMRRPHAIGFQEWTEQRDTSFDDEADGLCNGSFGGSKRIAEYEINGASCIRVGFLNDLLELRGCGRIIPTHWEEYAYSAGIGWVPIFSTTNNVFEFI